MRLNLRLFASKLSTGAKSNQSLEIRNEAAKLYENGLKYRFHPGVRNNPAVELPLKLHLAAHSVLNRHRSKQFRRDIEKIQLDFHQVYVNHDNDESDNQKRASNRKVLNFDDQFDPKKNDSEEAIRQIRKKFYQREPFNPVECAAYLFSRLTPNYAALRYVFNEIRREEPEFRPNSFFDFGSGVGSAVWAADEIWKGSLNEIFCVDLNENMNDLSRELLQKGTTHCDNILEKTFHRQFLPVKHRPGYDLVVSGFSLLDFPDTQSRIYLVENLWKKTNGMLVLIEHGNKAGFSAIMEARNFLLQISNRQLDPMKKQSNPDELNVSKDTINTEGSIVAPCPHEQLCPRLLVTDRKSYCNFRATYKVFDYGQPNAGHKEEKFSYLVMKKNDFQPWTELQKSWPRCVQQTTIKPRHSICRTCTNDGKIHEFILSKSKSSKYIYETVRRTKLGDKIPANLVDDMDKEAVKANKVDEANTKLDDADMSTER